MIFPQEWHAEGRRYALLKVAREMLKDEVEWSIIEKYTGVPEANVNKKHLASFLSHLMKLTELFFEKVNRIVEALATDVVNSELIITPQQAREEAMQETIQQISKDMISDGLSKNFIKKYTNTVIKKNSLLISDPDILEQRKNMLKSFRLVEEFVLKKGITQGEHKKSIEIAKNLIKSGIDKQVIKDSTGLSEAEFSLQSSED